MSEKPRCLECDRLLWFVLMTQQARKMMTRNAASFSGAHPVWLVDLQWHSKQMGGGMATEWTTLSDEEPWQLAATRQEKMRRESDAYYMGEQAALVTECPDCATLHQRLVAAETREAALREQVRVLRAAVVWYAENCSMPGEAIDALAATAEAASTAGQ